MTKAGLTLISMLAAGLLAGCDGELYGEVEVPDRKAFEDSFFPAGGGQPQHCGSDGSGAENDFCPSPTGPVFRLSG